MSAYSASAPVMASTTAPNAMKARILFSNMKRSACHGLSAFRITGASMILTMPMAASTRNHTAITGPKKRPMPAVPWRCTLYRATSTTTASGTTYCDMPGAATSMPSIAPSTEMAGVITLSP